ncbi:DUF983 domain-containing protein [Aureimonas leprariae]|uniref:DUF983 domain-containing protein n=2 Tax=Plantimonas leprariae TaxID=2615207 RepID=A0A7V7PSH3_9HYPH|nr:DUF983 domain-containing protein [Aureimonas leprariae]
MLRGLVCRCPRCGEGKLFAGYLRAVPHCSTCGEAFDGVHRADDLPPYLTVFVIGHLVVALFMALDEAVVLSLGANLAIFIPLTLVLCLAMLRPMKGLTIGLQWAMRMHGFGEGDARHDH